RPASRCSRRRRSAFVFEAQVWTACTVLRRPRPATRTHTFASRLDTSIPAHRSWTISMINSLHPAGTVDVRRGKGQKKGKSDARAHGNNPRFTVETLRAMLTNGLKAPQGQRRPPRRTPSILNRVPDPANPGRTQRRIFPS